VTLLILIVAIVLVVAVVRVRHRILEEEARCRAHLPSGFPADFGPAYETSVNAEIEIVREINRVRARSGKPKIVLAAPLGSSGRIDRQALMTPDEQRAHARAVAETNPRGWAWGFTWRFALKRRSRWSASGGPAATPGVAARVFCALLPGRQTDEWLAEAKDHLASAAEAGENMRQTRRGLFVALMISLPIAWMGELRRRWLRRA
jgi:hypothetical protein